jgi:hypothetical protein
MLKKPARVLSRILANHPRLLFSLQESWLNIGFSLLDLKMADWVIRRPEWLRKKSTKSLYPLETSDPLENPPNLELAERIISAFSSSIPNGDELIPSNSIWGGLRQAHYRQLRTLVENRDAALLADFYSRLFRSETVNGYTYGSTFDNWPHRWHYLPIQIELSVVQLAESIGLIRAECHEQGEIAYWRRIFTEEQLISMLEEHFGFRVEQPRYGDPRGIYFGNRFLTRETCAHLHTAYRISCAIRRASLPEKLNIVEIGGGFGGTCYWLRRVLGERVCRYNIVDLPEVSLVQSFFLGSVEPSSIAFGNEVACAPQSNIKLIPHFDLERIDFQPTIVLNQDSMPEMPLSEVERYAEWVSRTTTGLFVSFNQETYSATQSGLQVHVPAVLKRHPRFKRVSRDTSWDRRGYTEEVYILD